MSLRKNLGLAALLSGGILFGNVDNSSCNANPVYYRPNETEILEREADERANSNEGAGAVGLLFLMAIAGPPIAQYFKSMDYRKIGK